jgi:hypothetical protein
MSARDVTLIIDYECDRATGMRRAVATRLRRRLADGSFVFIELPGVRALRRTSDNKSMFREHVEITLMVPIEEKIDWIGEA